MWRRMRGVWLPSRCVRRASPLGGWRCLWRAVVLCVVVFVWVAVCMGVCVCVGVICVCEGNLLTPA